FANTARRSVNTMPPPAITPEATFTVLPSPLATTSTAMACTRATIASAGARKSGLTAACAAPEAIRIDATRLVLIVGSPVGRALIDRVVGNRRGPDGNGGAVVLHVDDVVAIERVVVRASREAQGRDEHDDCKSVHDLLVLID